jgi:hypothetical protein
MEISLKMQLSEIKALIRITTECNVHCRHCYVRSGKEIKDEISQPELEKIIEELAGHNVHSVCFTGGQPTLTGERLIEIIRFTSGLRIRTGFPALIQVTSNAMIGENDRIADYWVRGFLDAGLDRVRLSCDDWHREFIPEAFEHRFIEKANEKALEVKILRVVNPGNRLDENDETNPAEKIFALRPGGRGSSEEYSSGWNNISHCRIYQASHHPLKMTIFIHPTRDIHICNVGIPMDLSMGKILDDDLNSLLFGEKEGIVGVLSREDVEGLASCLGMDPHILREAIRIKGRCAVCAELRKAMNTNTFPQTSRSFS